MATWFRLKMPRNRGWTFLPDIKTAIRNDFIKPPDYFEAMCRNPFIRWRKAPEFYKKHLYYEEDRFLRELKKAKPEIFNYNNDVMVPGATRWYMHPADIFVNRQMDYMEQGHSRSEAFELADRDYELERVQNDIEVELAKQQAETVLIQDRSYINFKVFATTYKRAAVGYRNEQRRIIRFDWP